jgi:PAS domain S-box-containing protein
MVGMGMKGIVKGREQLVSELEALRQRVAELEKRDAEGGRVEGSIGRAYYVQDVINKLLHLSLETDSVEELLEHTIDYLASTSWLTMKSRGAIFLVEDEPEALVMKAQCGLPASLMSICARVPFGRCLCGRAALSGEVEFADCVDQRHENRYEGMSPHGHYCVPILSSGRVLGVINLYLKEGHHQNKREGEFLKSAADVLAGVIERKRMERELQEKNEQVEVQNEELRNTNEELRATEAELRASNDELQAADEELRATEAELRASNDELQAANEKLQATEAELRASNDELQAANEELQQKIAERKQAERALRDSEERYRTLVKLRGQFGAAVIMLQDTEQAEGVHTFVSDQWCHITGYSSEELRAMSFFDLVHSRDVAESMERHRRKMRDEAIPGLYELFIVRKDGTEVPIELTSGYTRYKGKAANVVYIRNITERKQMEQHLIITDRLASVGELASGIAHELNNPLTSVIGFSQLLLDKDIPEDIKEDVRIVSSEAQRAAGVVKNLLTFARKHAQAKELVNISDIIKKVLELRAYEQRVNNIRVKSRFAADLPQVMADYFQLQQVFLNIVINAEHFMVEAHNKGTLTITTEKVDNVVKASFADDGPGIPEEDLGHVFDPFFTTKEVGKGTGLGLSICHGIIAEHGGQIYARSELGRGATFTVELPIQCALILIEKES